MKIKNKKISSNPSISIDYLGDGDLIIFLHGIGGNKKNWEDNLKFFFNMFFICCMGYSRLWRK